jgi:putative SOS response-associated peptidase YedK
LANELTALIHDRMPVILSPVDYDAWLDPTFNTPEKLMYLYQPFLASEMTMKVAGNEGLECLTVNEK